MSEAATQMNQKVEEMPGYKYTKLGWIPEEWELVPVKLFGKVVTGSTPKTVNKEYYTGEFLFVSPADMNGVKYVERTEKRLSKSGYNTGRKINKGSPLFVSIGSTIGKTAIAGADLVTNQQINAVVPNNDNSGEYLYYQLTLNNLRFKRIAGNQAVPILNKSTFQSISIFRAPLPEQQKIAQILSTWDKAIAKTEQLITKKQERKKGLIQQLLTGKKRFKEFVKSDKMKETKLGWIPEDWQVKKVSDVFDFLSTNSFSRSQMHYEVSENSIYNIHYGDIHATYNEAILDFNIEKSVPIIFDEIEISNSATFLKEGDVIIADASEDYKGVGEAIELKNINEKKVLAGLHTFALRDKSSLTSIGFRAYIFKNPKVSKAIKVIATGSKVFGISKANLQKIELILPPIQEQQRIAYVFSSANQEISSLQNQLDRLKEQKKGLMQKLLTGEVRVKINET